MDELSDDFVDRTEQIKHFKSLIGDRRRRVLLISGLAGRGKTHLQHELRRISRDEQMVSAVVDFQLADMVTEPNHLIAYLSECLGDRFTAQMMPAEEDTRRPSVLDSAIGEAISKALSDLPQRQGSSVSVSNVDKFQVGGSIVGGHQYILNNSTFVLNPDGGREQDQAVTVMRQNARFRTALKIFLAEQKRVILFFDHIDKVTTPISHWLSGYLLNLILAETEGYSNLWIIVAGRHIPLQDESDKWQHILVSEQIDSLPDDLIYMIWNEKRGVDKVIVDAFIKGADGDTRILFKTLRNYVRSIERGSSDDQ